MIAKDNGPRVVHYMADYDQLLLSELTWHSYAQGVQTPCFNIVSRGATQAMHRRQLSDKFWRFLGGK